MQGLTQQSSSVRKERLRLISEETFEFISLILISTLFCFSTDVKDKTRLYAFCMLCDIRLAAVEVQRFSWRNVRQFRIFV